MTHHCRHESAVESRESFSLDELDKDGADTVLVLVGQISLSSQEHHIVTHLFSNDPLRGNPRPCVGIGSPTNESDVRWDAIPGGGS